MLSQKKRDILRTAIFISRHTGWDKDSVLSLSLVEAKACVEEIEKQLQHERSTQFALVDYYLLMSSTPYKNNKFSAGDKKMHIKQANKIRETLTGKGNNKKGSPLDLFRAVGLLKQN